MPDQQSGSEQEVVPKSIYVLGLVKSDYCWINRLGRAVTVVPAAGALRTLKSLSISSRIAFN